jgi:hypothetical protein
MYVYIITLAREITSLNPDESVTCNVTNKLGRDSKMGTSNDDHSLFANFFELAAFTKSQRTRP